jgi:subtilisin family serine protease
VIFGLRIIGAMAAAVAIGWTAPAAAQIGLPSSLPSLPSSLTDRVPLTGVVEGLARQTVDDALQAPARLTGLVRRSRGALQADPDGWPVVASEVVAVDLPPSARDRAVTAGFTVLREERLEALGLSVVVLAPPRRMALDRAVARLRDLAPGAEITFNHVASPAGLTTTAEPSASLQSNGAAPNARLGLIDTGIEATHPTLAGSAVEQRGFSGPPRMGAHGTAVASLMVGNSSTFKGGDPGAALLVADIYGGQATGGSATALASALAWMVERRVAVVNISLVGPRNPLVERAVAAAQGRGLTLVAAVGNDGPSAPPLFPASYSGVIGVTAVNAQGRILPEAGRGDQVDYAAPGADMAAAGQAGSFVSVRGTSFASPLVAGLIARSGRNALHPTNASAAGRDPVYGAGVVGAALRTAPSTVGARGRLTS